MEDARDLIPLGAHHRISWTMNINSMMHVVGKRSYWILQLGLWGPIIRGMIKEIGTKVHPVFYELASPPCVEGDSFTGCHYKHENERRVSGEDKLPICALYWHKIMGNDPGSAPSNVKDRSFEYTDFWGRDPWTGFRLSK